MLLDTLSTKAFTVRTLIECGMFAPVRPDKLVRALKAVRDWGATPAAGYTASAVRYPEDVAIMDELGALTFGETHRRTNALAHAWSDDG
ncbi:MAG: acyl-CoA synthetase, partial [Actinobacteria bacterium]|nr:acyl-CoA synthetase [Actinomycetota bacterium]